MDLHNLDVKMYLIFVLLAAKITKLYSVSPCTIVAHTVSICACVLLTGPCNKENAPFFWLPPPPLPLLMNQNQTNDGHINCYLECFLVLPYLLTNTTQHSTTLHVLPIGDMDREVSVSYIVYHTSSLSFYVRYSRLCHLGQ